MLERLKSLLTPRQWGMVQTILERCPHSLYLVGGPVRDLILGRPILDLDLAVEGSIHDFLRRMSADVGGRVTEHARFHTARIACPDGVQIDLAETRRERYPEAARLPIVETGASIEEDLGRRDFTIQSMALRLNGAESGVLVDPFHGREDLKRRIVRILHPDSFRDDPVRAFRAVRYATRYGFRIEPRTQAALRDLLRHPDYFAAASDRLFDEWRRSFDEARWIQVNSGLRRMGLLRRLGISSTPGTRDPERIDRAVSHVSAGLTEIDPSRARWIMLISHWPAGARRKMSERMPFPREVKKIFSHPVAVSPALRRLDQARLFPSDLVTLLSGVPADWLAVLYARAGARGRRRIREYATFWRRVRAPVSGDELARWGIAPGPIYPGLLKKLRDAWLDGKARTAADLRALAIRLSKRILPRRRI